MMKRTISCLFLLLFVFAGYAPAKSFLDLPQPSFGFFTFFPLWGGTTSPEFARFIHACKPEIVQVGFYGPMFHGYADNPASTGYPMQLPVSGQRQALLAQRKVNRLIHRESLKVVGHFQMVNVIVTEGHKGDFYDFYEHAWPDDLLGPRPTPDIRQLLQRDRSGNVIIRRHYVDYAGLCLSSPYTRQMLKRMLKVAIDAGLDGIITNYNYRWSCACPYCQAAFKKYLARKYTAEQLSEKFGISNLETYVFDRIAGEIPGYPDENATPLDWEAMQWSAIAFKEAFDEILIGYGRKLKPDLIIATWNHLGDMSIAEERMFLPIDMWGRGENYFWYSGGYGPTDLKKHRAGDGWLNCLYIREMTGGKPFVLGKYEGVRLRNSIAEGVATGGCGMGLYMNIHDPVGFQVCSSYLNFLRTHRYVYRNVSSCSEVGLVFPRRSILAGRRLSMDVFRKTGRALIDRHVLFDVIADERMDRQRILQYRALILPDIECLSDFQCRFLDEFIEKGGLLIIIGKPGMGETPARNDALRQFKQAARIVHVPDEDIDTVIGTLSRFVPGLTIFHAPWTVRVAAYSARNRIFIHFVNYDRDEDMGKNLRGPADECPVKAENLRVDIRIPEGRVVRDIRCISPDDEGQEVHVRWSTAGSRIQFDVPPVFVYSIIEIKL
jgi:hypothetical protein